MPNDEALRLAVRAGCKASGREYRCSFDAYLPGKRCGKGIAPCDLAKAMLAFHETICHDAQQRAGKEASDGRNTG